MQKAIVGNVAYIVFIAVTTAIRWSPLHSVPCIPIRTSFVWTQVQTLCEGKSQSIDVAVFAFPVPLPHESPASLLCSAYLPVFCICLAGTWYNKWHVILLWEGDGLVDIVYQISGKGIYPGRIHDLSDPQGKIVIMIKYVYITSNKFRCEIISVEKCNRKFFPPKFVTENFTGSISVISFHRFLKKTSKLDVDPSVDQRWS